MILRDLQPSRPVSSRRCRVFSICGLLLCNQCFVYAAQELVLPPSAGPPSSVTFTIQLQASAQLASNSTLQQELLTQLQANLAQFFSVNASQVVLTFRSAARSRMLLQALAPYAVDTTVSGNTTHLQQQVSSLQTAPARLGRGVSSTIQLDSASISIVPAGAGLPSPSPVPSPSLASPIPATLPSLPSSASPAPSTSKAGIIAAGVVAPVVVLGLLIGAALWWLHKRQYGQPSTRALSARQTKLPPETAASLLTPAPSSGMSDAYAAVQIQVTQNGSFSQTGAGRPQDMPDWLVQGDPFVDTACQYAWTDVEPGNITTRVESGVNDLQLDTQAKDGTCPVLELSSADVKQQLQLITSGLLGQGGAAIVLTCQWPARFGPNALLAAKVMTNVTNYNPHILQSFAHEANLLAAIRHPNVVQLYGYCLELPTVCLIMELLPGSLDDPLYKNLCRVPLPSAEPMFIDQPDASVGTACASSTADQSHSHQQPANSNNSEAATTGHQQQQLNMVDVLRIATDVAAGLAYLHNRQVAETEGLMTVRSGLNVDTVMEAGMHTALQETQALQKQNAKVVHRDLKPANILITSQGRAKISDFGLARQYASNTVHTVHMGAGTLRYQAPELLSGETGPRVKKPTNRCDVYSLGIMMWELLAREKPWQGLTVGQLMVQVLAKKRPPIPTGPTGSSPQQQAVVNLSQAPASFEALPELVKLITDCWQHMDLSRPTAAEVHERLCRMLERVQQQALALPVQHTASAQGH